MNESKTPQSRANIGDGLFSLYVTLQVDLLVGNNADEGSLFVLLAYSMGVFDRMWEPLVEATLPPNKVTRAGASRRPREMVPF